MNRLGLLPILGSALAAAQEAAVQPIDPPDWSDRRAVFFKRLFGPIELGVSALYREDRCYFRMPEASFSRLLGHAPAGSADV